MFFAIFQKHAMPVSWLMRCYICGRKNGLSPRREICEGFCNLGSFEILKSIGTQVAISRISALEQDPDPIYGEGFRRVKAVYDSGGWPAVINKLKNVKLHP